MERKSTVEDNLRPRVCIIGAGPSGITAVKNLQEQGLYNLTVFEKKQSDRWQLGL
jgi:cation diffusion facilitator CzcD-associated flavoprotein CzcO